MQKQKIELTLPATLKFSSLIRQIAEEVFGHAGFTKEWAGRLKLVVDELFMNANRYASKEEQSKIYILFEYDDKEVFFKIDDEGAGGKKISAEELKKMIHKNEKALSDTTKTSGRGLALISELWTDGLIIEDSPHGGLSIAFKKLVTAEKPPAPPVHHAPVSTKAESEAVSPLVQGTAEVVKIVGEIDQTNIEESVQPIVEKIKALPTGGVLTIDCSELKYFNSTFIGYLAAWHNELQDKGGQLVLKQANDEVKDVLNLVGLSRVIYLET